MRLAAVLVLSLATVAALAVTSLGASPGHNKFFIVTELLILAAAVGGVVATVASPRVKLVGAAIGLPAVCLLSLLLLPLLHSQRADVLAPLLPGQERGFVLAALGRPDLVSDGIGIAENYGYRTGTRRDDILVIRFQTTQRSTQRFDDRVASSIWMVESQASAIYGLRPPGGPEPR